MSRSRSHTSIVADAATGTSRMEALEADLRRRDEELRQCTEYGRELLSSLNEVRSQLEDAHMERDLLMKEAESLREVISNTGTVRRGAEAVAEILSTEKEELLRSLEDAEARAKSAEKRIEDFERMSLGRTSVPGLNLTPALSPVTEGRDSTDYRPTTLGIPRAPLYHDGAHSDDDVVEGEGLDIDDASKARAMMTRDQLAAENAELHEAVDSLEAEVTRLQVLLDEAFDDLECERRLRNEMQRRGTNAGQQELGNGSFSEVCGPSPRALDSACDMSLAFDTNIASGMDVAIPTLLADEVDFAQDFSQKVMNEWITDGSQTVRDVAALMTARTARPMATARGGGVVTARSTTGQDGDLDVIYTAETKLKKSRMEPNVINLSPGTRNVCIPVLFHLLQHLHTEMESRWVHDVEWTGDDVTRRMHWRAVMDGCRCFIAKLHNHHTAWMQGCMRALVEEKSRLEGELEAALQALKRAPETQYLMETCRAKAALCRHHSQKIAQKAYITEHSPLRVVFSRVSVSLTALLCALGALKLLGNTTLADTTKDFTPLFHELGACTSALFSAASFTLDHVPALSLKEIEDIADITATTVIRKYEEHIRALTFDGAVLFSDFAVAHALEVIRRCDIHSDLPLPDQFVGAVEGLQLVIVDRGRSKVGSRVLSYEVSVGVLSFFGLETCDVELGTTEPQTPPWTFHRITRESGIRTETNKCYAIEGKTSIGFRFDTAKHAVELKMVQYQGTEPTTKTSRLWIDDEELVQLTPSYYSFCSPILASLLAATPVLTAGLFVHQMRWDRPPLLMHKFVPKMIWMPQKCVQCMRKINSLSQCQICTVCNGHFHGTCHHIAAKQACGAKQPVSPRATNK